MIWVCGDLHFENFGTYKGDNRLVYFDINDFDEAVLAACTFDVTRYLTSLLVGAKMLRLDRPQARRLGKAFLDAYVAALVVGKARWVERATATDGWCSATGTQGPEATAAPQEEDHRRGRTAQAAA